MSQAKCLWGSSKTMASGGPSHDRTTANGVKEFRPHVSQFWTGIVATVLFALVAIGHVFLALENCDRSFQHPVAAAIALFIFWGGFSLLGAWLVADYFRSKLVLTEEGVVKLGVLWSRGMEFDKVNEARWRPIPAGGSLKLRDASGRMTITFGGRSTGQREELASRLRDLIPIERQSGWEDFNRGPKQRQVNPRASLISSLLLAAIFCGFAVLPVVMVGRGFLAGAQLVAVVAMNAAGFAMTLRMAWRAWGRWRREVRTATEAGMATIADASEKRR